MSGPVICLECEGFREGSTSWQASHGNQVLPSQVTFFPKEEVEEQSSSPRSCSGREAGTWLFSAVMARDPEQNDPLGSICRGMSCTRAQQPPEPPAQARCLPFPTALHLFGSLILPCTEASSEALGSTLLRMNFAENHQFLHTYSSSRARSCASQLVPLWAVRWGAQIPSGGGPHLGSV